MRVCIIEVTGSLRPHKADSVNPLFFLPKIENPTTGEPSQLYIRQNRNCSPKNAE